MKSVLPRLKFNFKVLGIFVPLIISNLAGNRLFGQSELSTWYFGFHAGIKFPGPVSIDVPHAMNTQEPSTSVVDQDGNLLFYSDGREVWNTNDIVMPEVFVNGTLDGGASSTQGVLSVRNPKNSRLFYLFTIGDLSNPIGLKYSVIDLDLDNGTGDVDPNQKNIPLLSNTAEGLAATLAENCSDVWVITHEAGNNKFRTFLVSPTGVSEGPSSEAGSIKANGESLRGAIQFSPKKDRFAMTFYGDNNNVEVFDFDRATGKITESGITLPKGFDYNDAYGTAFSPNGEKLYVTYYNRDIVRQYDLNSNNPNSIDLNNGNFIKMGQAKLGPDGKIYITRNEQKFLAVIEEPDKDGVDANYVENGFELEGTALGLLGMPQMIYQPELISLVSVKIEEATCTTKGSLEVYATGGAPPLKYSIDGGQTFQSSTKFENLPAGKYTIVIKDKNGCFITGEAEITKEQGAVINATSLVSDSCEACIGTITIHAVGGAKPIEYSIDGGQTFQKDSLFEGLCEDKYEIVIKDKNGCTHSTKVNINDDGIWKDATIKDVEPLCISDDPIQLEANTPGGIWKGNGVDEKTGIFTPGDAGPGDHLIEYIIEGICGASDTTLIVVKDKLIPEIEQVGPFCVSGDDIQLQASIPGGIWKGKGIIDEDKGIFSPKKARKGKHKITYTINDVCTHENSIEIEIQDKIRPVIEDVPTLCPSGKPITLKGTPRGGIWIGDGITDGEKGTFDPKKVGPGDYKVIYKLESNVCQEEDYAIIFIRDNFFTDIDFDVPKACSYYDKDLIVTAQLDRLKTIGLDQIIIDWGDGSDKEYIEKKNLFKIFEHTYEDEGTYKIKIKLIDELCGTDSIIKKEVEHRKIGNKGTITAPNIFTPNNDGINDYFSLIMLENKKYDVYDNVEEYEIVIYDRWGNEVFNTGLVSIANGEAPKHWDGTIQNKTRMVSDNVYFYMIKFKAKCYDDGDENKVRILNGFVHLN